MTEAEHPDAPLIHWLEAMQVKLQQLTESPAEPEQTFQDLLDMSQRFLMHSKKLLELGTMASQAAEAAFRLGNHPGEPGA